MSTTRGAGEAASEAAGRIRVARVRIEDVAEQAGVSMKTVSRVLNNEPNVSVRTRTLVEAVVEELRYRPLPSARVLAGRRSYLVAMLFDNPSSNYLMEIEMGVLDACQAQHYNLMLAPLVYDANDIIDKVEALVMQAQLDGVILTPPITDDVALLRRLEELGIPYSSISAKEQNRHVGVVVDEHGAVCAMMAHLASLGHRRIAHIRGHAAHGASAWRLAGYREGLRRAGLRYDARLVVDGEFSYQSGYAATNALLDLDDRPTAIFAANDDMAAGAICAICERGLSVPGDISVCGFDDTPIAHQIYPALTTVRQPTREMGRLAATELLKEVRELGSGGIVDVAYALQLRRSTGPAARD
ncbi:MAG TPA: LacI family DNA-binding transcriptional regulator [Thermomonas sp.]|jgi:LacI family transcriptional regulator|uniref:LacI family DNA-binding transcriptional regulator n=1 Tax=Thermomonas sp. TaxID=1971895 RepID=UPI002C01CC2C|nr:LacI family DNA-binding transcriptional regulator [Thermomonas sp.]HPW12190.1 LacI family DNA-binding transcriptional regulator [Thermomonas sp.]